VFEVKGFHHRALPGHALGSRIMIDKLLCQSFC
jgi:hypothetical protein